MFKALVQSTALGTKVDQKKQNTSQKMLFMLS